MTVHWHIGSAPLLSPGPGMTLWEAAVLGLPVIPLLPARPAVTTAQVVAVVTAAPSERPAICAATAEDEDHG